VSESRKILDAIGQRVRPELGFTVTATRCDDAAQLNEIPGAVVKKVFFIRHGEGVHNVAQKAWKSANKPGEPYTLDTDPEMRYIDALLTAHGEAQARALQARAARTAPQLLVLSPLRRATQTGLIAYDSHISKRSIKVIAHELCHELAGKHTCDKRLPRTKLASLFDQVDYSLVSDEEDPFWGDGARREPHDELVARCAQFIRWLRDRPEREIVVAAHSQFLFSLFNAVLLVPVAQEAEWFGTAEMRTMALVFH
jgi:broad specificity phosphatase PhoE